MEKPNKGDLNVDTETFRTEDIYWFCLDVVDFPRVGSCLIDSEIVSAYQPVPGAWEVHEVVIVIEARCRGCARVG